MAVVRVAVFMGVSGSGKSTVARRFAAMLGWRFQEGDDLHPAANVEKMRHGIPLDDADRAPWLLAIAAVIDGWRERGEGGVVTCSALKRAYRGVIIGDRPDVALIYLRGAKALIATRLKARTGHYMPASLLDTQLATIEEPSAAEHPVVVDVGPSADDLAGEIARRLGLGAAGASA